MADPNKLSMRDLLIPGSSDGAELIEQMSRKDELFSQIGDYISKVQAETGANAKTVEKKLKELDDTRKKLVEAEQRVKEFRHKQNQS